MTLKKIAEIANVSISTVSRALNDSYDISPKTREAVLLAAEECGYFDKKKRIKQENRRNRSINVAIICPEIRGQDYAEIAEQISQELKKRGSKSIIYCYNFDNDILTELLNQKAADTLCDAVICLGSLKNAEISCEMPIFAMHASERFPYFAPDKNDEINRQVLELFLKRNRSRIAFVGEKHTDDRCRRFSAEAEKMGIELFDEYTAGTRFEQAGKDGAEYLLSKQQLPDAILCGYDAIAFGVIHTLIQHGVRVPEDVTVVGINDITSASFFYGGLTSVKFEYSTVIPELVENVIECVNFGKERAKNFSVSARLVVRNT